MSPLNRSAVKNRVYSLHLQKCFLCRVLGVLSVAGQPEGQLEDFVSVVLMQAINFVCVQRSILDKEL